LSEAALPASDAKNKTPAIVHDKTKEARTLPQNKDFFDRIGATLVPIFQNSNPKSSNKQHPHNFVRVLIDREDRCATKNAAD
jgi:hypothetical protein